MLDGSNDYRSISHTLRHPTHHLPKSEFSLEKRKELIREGLGGYNVGGNHFLILVTASLLS